MFARGIYQISAEQAALRAQFFRGSLSNGERFETNESVIILGDVAKDAAVISKKDIIVLGALYGEAFAGVDGKNHFVAALDFSPHMLKIADCKEQIPFKHKKWGRKQNKGPMMAYLSDGHIKTKEIEFTEELLESLSVEG
jgi:septum site-determining protein MinC